MNLNWIRDFGPAGVYLLLDKSSKSFHISYTINFKYFVAGIVELIQGAPASSDFELLELSKSSDIETLKLHTEYWIDQYIKDGYVEMLGRGRKSVQYSVRLLVAPNLKGYDVQICNKRGTVISTVGRFLKKREAEDFIETYYAEDNPYKLPVFATNSLTKELLRETGEIGIRL